MKLRILTPEETLFDDEAEECLLPGPDEEFSVMNFHQPGVFRLVRGAVRYAYYKEGRLEKAMLRIRGGVAKIDGMTMALLIDKWR